LEVSLDGIIAGLNDIILLLDLLDVILEYLLLGQFDIIKTFLSVVSLDQFLNQVKIGKLLDQHVEDLLLSLL